jgi:hypothetical protein
MRYWIELLYIVTQKKRGENKKIQKNPVCISISSFRFSTWDYDLCVLPHTLFSLSELLTTETELAAMAAAANSGLSRTPKKG